MISEERLLGWLCIMRLQLSNGHGFDCPPAIRKALTEKGWMLTWHAEADRMHDVRFSQAGRLVSDLSGPEWGINPIPQEAP